MASASKDGLLSHSSLTGNAAVLLHGLADNRLGMIGYAKLLLAHGYSVLLPDARAHGVKRRATCDLRASRTQRHTSVDRFARDASASAMHLWPRRIDGSGRIASIARHASEVVRCSRRIPVRQFSGNCLRPHGAAVSHRAMAGPHVITPGRRGGVSPRSLEVRT